LNGILQGFPRTLYMPNSNYVCDYGDSFCKMLWNCMTCISELARLCHVAQNFAQDLSIAQGQRFRILLLLPLNVVFLNIFNYLILFLFYFLWWFYWSFGYFWFFWASSVLQTLQLWPPFLEINVAHSYSHIWGWDFSNM
jgi:hypothetical protein